MRCTRSNGRASTAFLWANRGSTGPPLIDPEKHMIRPIPSSLGRLMADRGVEVIRGEAALVGTNAARVGNRMIEARHIVIATGSKPRTLPIPGADLMDHIR
jgi:glutathione reductase (NADPH)